MSPIAGEPPRAHVEVQLSVENSKGFEEARLRILGELETYLKALAGSTDAEISGPLQEESKDGKKVGFQFEYKTPTNSGRVTVGPDMAGGGLLMTVEEWE